MRFFCTRIAAASAGFPERAAGDIRTRGGMKLQTKIFLGLGVGIAVGVASRLAGAEWLPPRLISLEPLGTAFIQLVTMVVVPLVVASVFVGVTSLGDVRRLGATDSAGVGRADARAVRR